MQAELILHRFIHVQTWFVLIHSQGGYGDLGDVASEGRAR